MSWDKRDSAKRRYERLEAHWQLQQMTHLPWMELPLAPHPVCSIPRNPSLTLPNISIHTLILAQTNDHLPCTAARPSPHLPQS